LKYESFIAQRFLPNDKGAFSRPLVRIAACSIALGVMVMVAAVCVLRGFQGEIRQKVVGFGSHIVVQGYALGNTYERLPISSRLPEADRIRRTPGVRHLQFFATKGGMVKTDDQIHGIIFKGVDSRFDSAFFLSNLVQGRLFSFPGDKPSNEVIISKTMADKLGLAVGDKARSYFWGGDTYRARAFTVSGIYKTDLAEFDERYVIGDLRQVQRLNGWDSLQVEGYEVLADDFGQLSQVAQRILEQLNYSLTLTTIVDENPALFSWLDLLDSNIVLIIILMMMVCAVSIISALLIMIFEKTSTIGILKTLGAENRSVRRIFLLKSASIIAKGIAVGDAAALLLCWAQKNFHLLKLDSESYSMDTVPIALDGWVFAAVSAGTLAVCLLALLVPTACIAKVEPAKTIKFD